MKKLLVIPVLAIFALASCSKKENDVSQIVTHSTPTINVTSSRYFSIPVNGTFDASQIHATAYDSFYKTSYPVVIDQSTLDVTTPGLDVINITSKNLYGMVGTATVYVAVTNIPATVNLAGRYIRISNNDTVTVTKYATGLYSIDNAAGVLPGSTTAGVYFPAFFVQTDDTSMVFPPQNVDAGTVYGTNTRIDMVPADTTFQYQVQGIPSVINPNAIRKFLKL